MNGCDVTLKDTEKNTELFRCSYLTALAPPVFLRAHKLSHLTEEEAHYA